MKQKKSYQGIYQERVAAPWEFLSFSGGHYAIKRDVPVTYKRNRSITIDY